MLEKLKQEVYKANMDLVKHGLVIFTWGNASGRDPETGYVVIKPSGVDYEVLRPEDMVVLNLKGKVIEGKLNPSSDTPTHLEIYREHSEINGIVHTHSTFATSFAQAGKEILALGTTHADYFYGDVPCTRKLTASEVDKDYERYTGKVINDTLPKDGLKIPAVLVLNHGPFAFGKDVHSAVYHAVVLEEVAKMNYLTQTINPRSTRADQYLLDKHYQRKHGKDAYYGQKG